ncbi:hypothetical protein Trydic_g11260 [Trypoxylus dichotomus]
MHSMYRFLQIFIVLFVIDDKLFWALPIENSVYSFTRYGRLLIKPFSAVENLQSDLYEVFMEPYGYELKPIAAVASFSTQCDGPIKGDMMFMQLQPPTGPVFIQGNITGLSAGKHGIHIHEGGDIRSGCENLGGHFNPYFLPHGSPSSPMRHIGDLGNIVGKDEDIADFKLVDSLMSLVGPRSVVGRALVITSEEDDLGRYGTPESITTGSTGKPIACAVVSYIN